MGEWGLEGGGERGVMRDPRAEGAKERGRKKGDLNHRWLCFAITQTLLNVINMLLIGLCTNQTSQQIRMN